MNNLPPFVIGLPIYSLYKIMQKMEKQDQYEFKKVGTKMEVAEIPEGKIYLIDAEGNGAGKYPVFVSKKENADFEGMVNKVLEVMKQLLAPNEAAEPFVLEVNPNITAETQKTPITKTKTTKK